MTESTKKILVLGASSFLGWHGVKHLLDKGYKVCATWMTNRPQAMSGIDLVRCNLQSRAELASIDAHDAVVLYASVVVGGRKRARNVAMVEHVAEYCRRTDARCVYISSSQIGFDIETEYRTSKLESERIINQLGGNGAVIRPAAPYGPAHEFTLGREQPFHVLAGTINKLPVVPVIGSGKQYRQPVHVRNLNQLVEWCCVNPEAGGKTFELGGAERLTMNDLIRRMCRAAGKPNRWLVHMPVPIFQLASHLTSFVDPENAKAVTCDESADNTSWNQFVDLDLIPFDEGVLDLFRA